MALPALRAGLGLGRSYATRIAKVAGHGGGARRCISSGADREISTPTGAMAFRLSVFCAKAACVVLVTDNFVRMGKNVEKIRVAMDRLVEHQTRPPVPSDPGNAAGVGAAGIAKPATS